MTGTKMSVQFGLTDKLQHVVSYIGNLLPSNREQLFCQDTDHRHGQSRLVLVVAINWLHWDILRSTACRGNWLALSPHNSGSRLSY